MSHWRLCFRNKTVESMKDDEGAGRLVRGHCDSPIWIGIEAMAAGKGRREGFLKALWKLLLKIANGTWYRRMELQPPLTFQGVSVLHYDAKAGAWNPAPTLTEGPACVFPWTSPVCMPRVGWVGFQHISLDLCILPFLETCSWPNVSLWPIWLLPICLWDSWACLLLPELLRSSSLG